MEAVTGEARRKRAAAHAAGHVTVGFRLDVFYTGVKFSEAMWPCFEVRDNDLPPVHAPIILAAGVAGEMEIGATFEEAFRSATLVHRSEEEREGCDWQVFFDLYMASGSGSSPMGSFINCVEIARLLLKDDDVSFLDCVDALMDVTEADVLEADPVHRIVPFSHPALEHLSIHRRKGAAA